MGPYLFFHCFFYRYALVHFPFPSSLYLLITTKSRHASLLYRRPMLHCNLSLVSFISFAHTIPFSSMRYIYFSCCCIQCGFPLFKIHLFIRFLFFTVRSYSSYSPVRFYIVSIVLLACSLRLLIIDIVSIIIIIINIIIIIIIKLFLVAILVNCVYSYQRSSWSCSVHRMCFVSSFFFFLVSYIFIIHIVFPFFSVLLTLIPFLFKHSLTDWSAIPWKETLPLRDKRRKAAWFTFYPSNIRFIVR